MHIKNVFIVEKIAHLKHNVNESTKGKCTIVDARLIVLQYLHVFMTLFSNQIN